MLPTDIKNINGKFCNDMLVNWLYGGIRTLLFLWWTIIVELVLKGTSIERPLVIKDHLEILWISSLYPTKSIHVQYFCGLCHFKKDVISYSKNISDVKKVMQRKCKLLNNLKVWNHCEAKNKDISARLCRSPAHKAN